MTVASAPADARVAMASASCWLVARAAKSLVRLVTRFCGSVAAVVKSGCFCARRSAARILFDLHRHELVHISGYTRVSANGQWRPLWSWGDGEDAIAPGPVPGSERIKKYRDKMSADDKDFDAARRRQKRRVVKRDPLVAAFFGS